MGIHLVNDRDLQQHVEYSKRPKRIEIGSLGSKTPYKIERNRPQDICKNERRKDWKFFEATTDQQDRKKDKMRPEAGRPEQKIETCQMHLLLLRSDGRRGAPMDWILAETEE